MARSDLPSVVLVGGNGAPSGVPRHILHLCTALADSARITVISDHDQGGYTPLKDTKARHVICPGLTTSVNPIRLCSAAKGLLGPLRDVKGGVVWLHARLPVLLGRLLLALRLWRPEHGTRVALTYHGLPFGRGHRRGPALVSRGVEAALLSLCPPLDLVFLDAEQAERFARAMGPRRMARHRTHVLGNASDLGPLPARTPRPGRHLVMTGRTGYQKNLGAAVRLLRHLPDDVSLTLAGPGTETPGFQTRMQALIPVAAHSRLRFAGPLEDVRPLLASADGYLLSSRYEGQPIGALEAFEAGLPIVLNHFEGARALAATHPLAHCGDIDDAAAFAAQTETVLAQYAAMPERWQADIHAAWARHYDMDGFTSRARGLLGRLTDPL